MADTDSIIAPDRARLEELGRKIPQTVRFGTSTWNYPGWRGLVYQQDYGPKGAAAKMLEEYAAFPLFRTVGIDSTFYGPPTEAVLRSYAEHLPQRFPVVSKVWSQLTVHTFTKAQDPARAGKINADFLNPDLFVEEIYQPYQRHFADNAGPFVFEFQTLAKSSGIDPERFATRLDEFFSALPREGQFAVEIRNEEFLTPMYFAVLTRTWRGARVQLVDQDAPDRPSTGAARRHHGPVHRRARAAPPGKDVRRGGRRLLTLRPDPGAQSQAQKRSGAAGRGCGKDPNSCVSAGEQSSRRQRPAHDRGCR